MWLNNTATTAMMVPIANAVLMELKAKNMGSNNLNDPIGYVRHLGDTMQSA